MTNTTHLLRLLLSCPPDAQGRHALNLGNGTEPQTAEAADAEDAGWVEVECDHDSRRLVMTPAGFEAALWVPSVAGEA